MHEILFGAEWKVLDIYVGTYLMDVLFSGNIKIKIVSKYLLSKFTTYGKLTSTSLIPKFSYKLDIWYHQLELKVLRQK